MSNQEYRVAVAGATGAVGEAMLSILSEHDLPISSVTALASARSEGKVVKYGDKNLRVLLLDSFDFSDTDIVLFSAGASVAAEHAHRAVEAGAVVIDNSSCFRYQDDIPLVVPEVNAHALALHSGIIANPNCSTIQLVVALKPLLDESGIDRINICTYQAVSGAGQKGVDELAKQTLDLISGRNTDAEVSPTRIAFNAVPHIDVFQDNGYTKEEMKMVWETRKILEQPDLMVNPTAVRVPVFYGHSEAVHIETKDKLTADEARRLLTVAPGVTVVDDPNATGGYPTAAIEATDHNDVFVGRIREDISHPRGLNLWVVSDNVRKGAALNTVQIAERLIKDFPESLRGGQSADFKKTGTA